MENKTIIILGISIILISLILLIAVFFIIQKPNVLPSPDKGLENCTLLKEGNKNAVNLVFFSTKQDAERYSNILESISPFNKFNSFNIYYIPDYTPECEIYKGIALLCYSSEIIKKASSCPNDYVITIKDQEHSIRSSEYMGFISINSKHFLTVLPHEFGHAFVNLAEEYVPAEIPRGSKNCASSCEKFTIKDGCYEGCSRSDYFRSIENGLMRTLSSSNYGVFNEKLIEEKLLSNNIPTITSNAVYENNLCENQKYYLIKAQYSNNQINLLDKSIEYGCLSNGGSGPFTYNLITSNQIINGNEFNPEFIFTDAQLQDQEIISGQTYQSDIPFMLKIPIIPDSKSMEILKDNQKISEIQLSDIGARPCKI